MARDYSPLPWIVLVSLLIFAIWAVVVHFLGLGWPGRFPGAVRV